MTNNRLWNKFATKKLIFWDFDGVIKDSVKAKGDCFVGLFKEYSETVKAKIRKHHEENGGVSRIQKIPIYIEMSGQITSDELVKYYLNKLEEEMIESVIKSKWVKGFPEFIKKLPRETRNIIVTGTPQEEMQKITRILGIRKYFRDIYGAPSIKAEAIKKSIKKYNAKKEDCIMIGDSKVDAQSAEANGVEFVLRRHETNNAMIVECGNEFTEYND